MGRIEKLMIKEAEIIVIDYANCNQNEMVLLMKKAKELILTQNQPVLLLCVFNEGNHITPNFIRQLEIDYKEIEESISKNAVIGLSTIQKWILKGVNLWTKRKIEYFDTREEAIRFLISQ
ncbi:MAG: hypothetical protein JSS93_00790 [Bacteroidetes bacterium]|nr:hypothetical protein [Bacteroidota bacterium]